MLSLGLKYQGLKYGLRGSVADKLRKLRDDESGATAIARFRVMRSATLWLT